MGKGNTTGICKKFLFLGGFFLVFEWLLCNRSTCGHRSSGPEHWGFLVSSDTKPVGLKVCFCAHQDVTKMRLALSCELPPDSMLAA